MSIAYHGNYCGPGWSAGAYQPSVDSGVPSLDKFDDTCKTYDALYSTGGDLAAADLQFAVSNLTLTNPKRLIAGALVGTQGLLRYAGVLDQYAKRPDDKNTEDPFLSTMKLNLPSIPKMTKREKANLRKVIADQEMSAALALKPKLKQSSRYLAPLKPSLNVSNPPVSIGTTIRASKPTTIATRNGIVVRGREFLCQVFETSNANFQLSASAPLHPAFYVASTMGQLSRAYQKYRFRRLAIHFVTRQPTSVSGEIALVYASQITEPAENGASGNFLPRVMTRGDAILGPLWQNHSIEIPCDDRYRLIDPFVSPDIATHIFGEVQCYTQSGVTDAAGYLLIDYELELNTTMFAPHSTQLPISSGPGAQYTLVDSSTTPTALNSVQLTNSTNTEFSIGTVFKAYINADESTVATGTTLANSWQTTVQFATSTTVDSSLQSTFAITDGQIVYLVVVGSSIYVYNSLGSALTGAGTGQLYYRTTGSTAGSYPVNAYLVQFGTSQSMTTQ
jgi:hypothetical protein